MRKLIFVSVLAAAAAISCPALAGPQDVTLTCIRENHDFTLKQIPGRYVAVHFIQHPDQPAATAGIKDYFEKAQTLAGIYHIFVSPQSPGELKAWASQFKDQDLMIAADPKGELAKECKANEQAAKGNPVTIVFDPSGSELLRREGKSPEDLLSFDSFKQMLDPKWKANTGEYNLPKGESVALQGYDPVAYFGPGATKGNPTITSEYRGVTYQFASADNRKLFARNPERYLPTYGGWCATAMGKKGEKVEVDPENYEVTNGRLFLFYKGVFANAKPDWDKHLKEWEPAADRCWKGFSGEDPVKPGQNPPKK